jgi:hypothetical protein
VTRVACPPYFLALYPLFFLWAWNVREVDPGEVLAPVVVLIAATFVLLVAIRRVVPSKVAGSIVVSAFWILTFSFGPLHEYFAPLDGRLLFGAEAVFLLVLFLFARKVRSSLENISRILTVVTLFLLIMSGVEVARFLPKRAALYSGFTSPVTMPKVAEPDTGLPDVYYIILDAYGRADVLRDRFQFDNEPFVRALSERGFRVLEKSRANYVITFLSLASSLNMEHAADLNLTEPIVSEILLIRNSAVARMLKDLGYTSVAVSSGRMDEVLGGFDRVLHPTAKISPFQMTLLNMTPLKIVDGFIRFQYRTHGANLLSALDNLGNVEVRRPAFIIGHLFAPHPPFVFDRAGNFVYPRRPISFMDGSHFQRLGGTEREYREGYPEFARFLNERLLATIDRILARPGPRPIIIIQGDHGPGSDLDWASAENSDVLERAGILNAWLAPEPLLSSLPDTLTPVNSFRYLFHALAGTDLALRPDSTYYTGWDFGLHSFVDITNRLNEDEAKLPR